MHHHKQTHEKGDNTFLLQLPSSSLVFSRPKDIFIGLCFHEEMEVDYLRKVRRRSIRMKSWELLGGGILDFLRLGI
jgi:hypothetical protein